MQMMQQFARGSALSGFNAVVLTLVPAVHAQQVALATTAVDADDNTNIARRGRLVAHRDAMVALTDDTVLGLAGIGIGIVKTALQELASILLPNKILQRVKRYLRREARKPVDMSVKAHLMHVIHIDNQEIPRLPPNFNNAQCLGDDEIVDILLFGAPKSWQGEMDCQGFDPLTHTPHEVVQFMERIEMSEDFDGDKKTTNVAKNNNEGKKKSNFNKGSSDADGSKHCMLHGNNNTHDTSECKTLMAQAKKLKGNNGANQKGKGGNKSWKNKAKDKTDDSKKELAALVKKATQLIKQQEPNTIELKKKDEPVKKRKVKWPSAEDLKDEQVLDTFDAELKDFNYGDLERLEIKDGSDNEKEDGEMDISVSNEISV